MKKDKNINEFKSADFYLCAYLLLSDMQLIRTERTDSSKVFFVLKDIPKRQELINDFYANKATVDPLEYKNKLGDMKSLIYQNVGEQK